MLHIRPPNETFHEFLINLMLSRSGKSWFESEMRKPIGERHIILRWRHEIYEQVNAKRAGDIVCGQVSLDLSGNIKALLVLADDIYQLEHAFKTPRKIIQRLRDSRQFQGARYEILAASVMARCGFYIGFMRETLRS